MKAQPALPGRERPTGRASVLRTATAWLRRSPQAVLLTVTAVLATAFAVTPAYADDPGLQCAVSATGQISVEPSPVVYGQNAVVRWGADGIACGAEDALVISGPGFDPSTTDFPVGGGSRSVFIGSTGSVTWDVTVVDLSSDTGFNRHLASVTASVTGVTVVPDVRGDTQAQASQAISAAGYVLGSVSTAVDCDNVGVVRSQNPSAGTSRPLGSTVAITIGKKPAPPRICE
ncbi:PASTA domain-containing protein [Streptomyces fagopyri]|uniref:PASTA domain-containing protein n=1 Tax=Streptomyces fagopyri TaxID=2662397 RepID=A0A5Q0L8J2_9ACTN|nr:PASTA domain-containing protein [Streptomyces fagopyri]QFZ72877.1 PASTA domain-containing protein [Streptomyces fagopyri]